MKISTKNRLTTIGFTILLGAFAGLVIWCFLKAVSICTTLIWDRLPSTLGNRYILFLICALGGLLVGLLRKKYGDYPEELFIVMGKIKKDKYYSHEHMPAILLCAFIPLIMGSSVGPEAGLTGIIAALCYWVGDNVTYAKKNAGFFSEIGEVVTLGQLFHSPLFGILAVEEGNDTEDDSTSSLTRMEKIIYYGISTAASFFVMQGLNFLFGKAMAGFPSFEKVTISPEDYVLILLYIPIGVILYCFFEKSEKITHLLSSKIPAVLREVLCGLVIGLMGLAVPMVIFSGEEQMAELMETPGVYLPLFLIGICLLKMIMTSFCISFGMKGGHFFPVIFACTCMGYGLAGVIFSDSAAHVVFAAGIITASMLGAQIKKPMAVAILLLLCFPARFLFWLFLGAAAGAGASRLIGKKES